MLTSFKYGPLTEIIVPFVFVQLSHGITEGTIRTSGIGGGGGGSVDADVAVEAAHVDPAVIVLRRRCSARDSGRVI